MVFLGAVGFPAVVRRLFNVYIVFNLGTYCAWPHPVIRAPYFEIWIASIFGICLFFFFESRVVWVLCCIAFLFSPRPRFFALVVLIVSIRTFAELEIRQRWFTPLTLGATVEPFSSLPKELIELFSNHIPFDARKVLQSSLNHLNLMSVRLKEALGSTNFPDLAGFRRAIILGDAQGIPASQWGSLNYLGLTHLFIISGSHISFILIMSVIFLRRLNFFKKFYLPRVLAFCLVTIFLLLAHKDLSILRAFLCFVLISIGGWIFPVLHRLRASERLAAVGVLFAWILPASVVQPTYALSFSTSWVLLRSQELGSKKSSILVFIAVAVFVFCVCVLLGLGVHPLSALANLLFAPLLQFVVLPLAIFSIPFSSAEKWANTALHLFYGSVDSASQAVAALWPAEAHDTWIGAFFLVTSVAVLQKAGWSIKRRATVLSLGMIVLCVSSTYTVRARVRGFQVTILDVGQGDAILLGFGKVRIAIDGGGPIGGIRQLLPALRSEWGGRLDVWVLSHFDQDHVKNFEDIRYRVRMGEIWINRFDQSAFATRLKRAGVGGVYELHKAPRGLCDSGLCFECFPPRAASRDTRVANEDSLVCVLYENASKNLLFLSAGDLPATFEPSVLGKLAEKGLSVSPKGLKFLKVSHHGSKNSSSIETLRGLRPQWVSISLGRKNVYGFPHEALMSRIGILQREGEVRVLRSDALGSIKVHFDN